MKKHNVYMAQPAYLNGKSAYIPYAVGTLIAYAQADEKIAENYNFADIIFIREDPDVVISQLEDPFYVGFSCYMWNIEYNKVLASKIKERYPDCVIQFGGHQVYPGSSLLDECPFVDFAMHNEGEIPFTLLLKELLKDEPDFSVIPNISYRKDGIMVNNPCTVPEGEDYPSPYLTGVFDKIIAEHPDLEFIPMLETNRGCPNHCAYCGWGMYKSKIRMFPMERIYNEIKWISDHKCEFIAGCDANFGMFERDEQIVDWVIDFKKKTGYPDKFQISYAKNSTERIFNMTKKLNDANMDKGVTLAFQSLSPKVLENIGRSNIKIDYYSNLLKMYTEAGIPTYSDLIVGLPGETYDSFINGVDTLLKAGQHSSLFIHILEWLPCSAMGMPGYMEHFGLEYTVIPLNQPHRLKSSDDDITEYSRIITKTNTMSHDDWIRMNLFAACVLCFHHLGLLEHTALYCYYSLKKDYGKFYDELLMFLLSHPETVAGRVFNEIKQRLEDVINKNAPVVFFNDEKYDAISWTKEEYAFLEIVSEKDRFYEEIREFLDTQDIPDDICDELVRYQHTLVKTINNPHFEAEFSFDLVSYFSHTFVGEAITLEKRSNRLTIDDPATYSNWKDYARFVLWYGRRGGKNLYRSELTTEYFDQ